MTDRKKQGKKFLIKPPPDKQGTESQRVYHIDSRAARSNAARLFTFEEVMSPFVLRSASTKIFP